MSTNTEKQLVKNLKSSEPAVYEQAWEALLQQYADDLRRDILKSLNKRGISPDYADDIEQQTWLTAVRKVKDFELLGEGKLYRWLRVISLKHILNLVRGVKDDLSLEGLDEEAQKGPSLLLDHLLYKNGVHSQSAEVEALLQERLAVLVDVIRILSPRDREIVMRRWVGDEKPQDFAHEYKVTAHAISKVLTRAKRKLIDEMVARGLIEAEEDK